MTAQIIERVTNPPVEGGDTLARKWIIEFDLNYGISGTPNWAPLTAITDQTPQEDPSTQDSSTYDSNGWKSSTVTALGWGWEITVNRRAAADGRTYPTVQEYLRNKSLQMGPGNLAKVRAFEWNGVDGPRVQAYEGLVGVAYSEQGGGMDALAKARFTLTGNGKRTDIVHPLAPVPWTASTAHAVGSQVTVTGGTLQAIKAGTSGASAPTNPATVGATVNDSTVIWRRII